MSDGVWELDGDGMPVAVFAGDDNTRVRFLNPVLANPWRSLMPVGFSKPRDIARTTIYEPFLNLTKRNKRRLGCSHAKRKPSKRDRCVNRLNRLHPALPKSKIRAALTLCEGDTAEALRLLDECMRKTRQRSAGTAGVNLAAPRQEKETSHTDINQNCIVGAVEGAQGGAVAPLGSFPKSAGVAPAPAMCASVSASSTSSDKRSTVTADSDEVDVCGLSDSDQSECFTCKKVTWKPPPNKVGVIIKRTRSGKYTASEL